MGALAMERLVALVCILLLCLFTAFALGLMAGQNGVGGANLALPGRARMPRWPVGVRTGRSRAGVRCDE